MYKEKPKNKGIMLHIMCSYVYVCGVREEILENIDDYIHKLRINVVLVSDLWITAES